VVKINYGYNTLHSNDSVHFNGARSLYWGWGGTFCWVDDKKEKEKELMSRE